MLEERMDNKSLPRRLCIHAVWMLLMILTGGQGALAQEPSTTGTYHGLVTRTIDPPLWSNAHLGARFELTVAANGGYNGKVITTGTPLSFSGFITSTGIGTGTSSTTIPRGALPALTLDLDFSNDAVGGTITHPDGEMASVSAWRRVWDNTARPATDYLGRYNFYLPTSLGEAGHGIGTFTVAANGDLTVSGKLPDGTAFKTVTFLGPDGQVLIYQTLPYGKMGSLIGMLRLTPAAEAILPTLSVGEVGMSWFKPQQTAASERFFKDGFITDCSVIGGIYVAPASGDIAAGLLDVNVNGAILFEGLAAYSETPANSYFTLTSANKLTMAVAAFNPAKTTLTVKPATGEISGGFTLVDNDYNQQTGTDKDGNPVYKKLTRKVKFEGIIVDDGITATTSGFYITPTNPDPSTVPPTTLTTSPLTGGTVSLAQNPEAPPPLYIGFDTASLYVTEGEPAILSIFTTEPLTETRTFTISVAPGTATAADLSATSIKISIPAGSDHAIVQVPVKDDGLDEEDEIFYLRVDDGAGFDLSDSAVCEVTLTDDDYPVEITGDPQSQMLALGGVGGFRVEAQGSDLQFQWQRNSTDISGATSNPLAFTNVQLSQAGLYRVKVSNAIAAPFSGAAELAVVDTGVRLVSLAPGNQAVLTANVAGPPGSLTYQWMLSGSTVENDTGGTPRITGATTPTLTIRNLSAADIGDYVCVVQQTSSFLELSSGEFRLRLPSVKPSLADVELPEGQILRPYFFETLFDTDFEAAPGSFSATGLPAGLSIDPNTGIISGIPTTAVTNVTVTITATNLLGSTSVQSLLTVLPFPAAALGTFHGLVDRVTVMDPMFESTPWPRAEMGARIELQTTATGGFSGKLLNGSTLPFSGQLNFDDTGILSGKTTVAQTASGLPPLHLQVVFDLDTQTFSGTLGDQDATLEPDPFDPNPTIGTFASVWGWRNAWSQATPATAYLGRYNFTLASDGSGDPYFTPEGTGFGTFVSIASGTFNVTGMMPDGTTFICNTFLGPDGQVLLYQPLFKNPGSLHGAIQVNLQVDDGSSGNPPGLDPIPPTVTLIQSTFETSPEGLRCSWNKPSQTDAKDKLYRVGFPTVYFMVDGGLYTPPEAGAIVMDLPDVALNAELQFYSSTASTEFPSQDLTIPSTGKPTVPTGVNNPMKLTFTLNAATGEFNGAFTKLDEDPNRPPLYNDVTGRLIRPQGYFSRSARYYGIIVNNSILAGGPGMSMGSGLFTIPQLPTTDTDPPVTTANAQTISGRLMFARNPESEEPLTIGFTSGGFFSFSESEAGMVMPITVNMSQPQSSRRTIPLSIQHRTTSAADFTISATSVVFEPGATEAYVNLVITQDNLDEVDEVFYLKLADGPGYNLFSSRQAIAIMDDDTAVQINRDPSHQLVSTNNPFSLDVEVEGSDPFSFQWRRDGVDIPGAIQQMLSVDIAKLSDGGRYDVVVTNRVGSVISAKANVAVMDSNERFFPLAAGSNASLSLNINAPAGSVTYQWIRALTGTPISDDAHITGSTTKTLVINNTTIDDEGDYVCVVTQPSSDIFMPGLELPSPLQHLIIVSEKPALIALPALTGAVALPFGYQVEFQPESYRRPASFSATNLPAGLSIDVVTGLISGSPSAAVTNRAITVTATNAGGSDSVNTTITIDPLPASIIGTFHGYVDRNLGQQISDIPPEFLPPWSDAELGGLMEITTLPTGGFSGKLTYGGTAHGFTGKLIQQEGAGIMADALIQRTGKPPLLLTFSLDPLNPDMIMGQVDVSAMLLAPAPMQAWKQVWSVGTPATAYAGNYTFALGTDSGFSDFSPGGAGFATCTVPLNGAPFEIKGRLPDGTAFVCSSLLGPRGEFIVYQGLYARLGSVLAVQRLGAEPDAPAGDPVFVEAYALSTLFKPAQTSASETIYRNGIGPVGLMFEGGRAVVTAPTNIVMGLTDGDDNAMISFMNANVEGSETPPNTVFRIRAGGTTNMKSGVENPAKVTVTVKPTTSEFSGSFLLSDTNPLNPSSSLPRSSSFLGMFIQRSDGSQIGRGYFTLKQLPDPGAIPPTTVSTAPSFTGLVEIMAGPGVP
jgi:hypothetical protein